MFKDPRVAKMSMTMWVCPQSSPSVKLVINVTVMNYVKVLAHHKNKCSGRYLKKSPYFGKPVKKLY